MNLAALPDDVKTARASPLWAEAKTKLGDREWRLDNLYYIRNDQGERVPFIRNEAQRAFCKEMAARNVLPKARKLGFSTLIAILILDRCIFRAGHQAQIIDLTIKDAQDKLAMIRFGYNNLLPEIRNEVKLTRGNIEELEWSNGSSVSVGTSARGGTPGDLHVSEYGKISTDKPDSAREIKTGAIQAVPLSGRIWVESTAHGTAGEFHDMVKMAEAKALAGTALTPADFKFHFYGWWIKPENRLQPNLVTVNATLKEYFAEIEAKIRRKLDAAQRAWYAKKVEELGPDDIKEEHPSTADELFYVSTVGAYWRDEIAQARRERRIGQPVPHDPTRLVNTMWDIGEDCTAIWFHQTDGLRHRWIDYWEEEGGSLQRAAGVLDLKKAERKFKYGIHYGPHDLGDRDWAHEGKTRVDTAKALGINFHVVPRVLEKGNSIEAARRLLGMSWFCSEHTDVGVTRLENYRKRWNKLLAVFTSEPVHNMDSHGSDAFQQGAMGLKPEVEKPPPRRPRSKGSAWAR